MIKIYKDLTAAYFIITITLTVCFVIVASSLESVALGLIMLFVTLGLVLLCAVTFTRIASKRLITTLEAANEHCKIEESLNSLYGLYTDIKNPKASLIVAIYMSNLLAHMGKSSQALSLLLQYDAERIFKRKNETVFKYLYYYTLGTCYLNLERNDDAVCYLNMAERLLESPHFYLKMKPTLEARHRLGVMVAEDSDDNIPKQLALMEENLKNEKMLLSKVCIHFSIARLLEKCDRAAEADEHIQFIKDNGGDSCYARCVLKNDFSKDFLNEINNKPWNPTPVKVKRCKSVIASVAIAVIMVAALLIFGFATSKTIYQTEYDSQDTYSVYTFDANGDILTFEEQCHVNYRDEISADNQYEYLQQYIDYHSFEGCEVTLTRDGTRIDFDFKIDFNKAYVNDEELIITEHQFLAENSGLNYKISRYKKFLNITWFDGILQ